MFSLGPTASPATQGPGSSRSLDSAPPMPPRQGRSSSVLFTPPADEGAGMGALGSDPMVQDMAAMKAIDMALQRLSINHPEAVDPLAQLQMSFRQLMAGIMTMQSQGQGMQGMQGGMMQPGEMAGGMGAPNIVPPLPMQGGPSSGMQSGPGI